jgi:NADH dehydrogenase FAD-containing subunit
MTFAVIGGGPTGVEIAGSIAELSRHTLVRDFRNIRPERARIILVEAGDRILGSFASELSEYARTGLEKLGVEVVTGKRVRDRVSSDFHRRRRHSRGSHAMGGRCRCLAPGRVSWRPA